MRKIVLSASDIEKILASVLSKDDEDSARLLKEYQEHDDEHSIISYLLLTVEDRLATRGYSKDAIIEKIFSLEREIWMSFFDCDISFLDFLMQNTKDNGLDIIDELPVLVENFHNHEYPRIHT